jgi:DNA-binding MarR family transcriptional regulator
MNEFQILHRLIHLFKEKEACQFEITGLSGKELYVLEHIREDNPWRFNDFAENYCIKPSTLTGIVTRLEKKGLVRRERSEKDRKAVYLHCTPSGQGIARKHIEGDQIFFSSMLSALHPVEKKQFLQLVQKITENRKYTSHNPCKEG